ncbi:FAD:protein FMN transferase [Sedimentitalea sp. XS_ASV28]|uniref:FAD:protein FMN transferase n=1 Tax=Sedimentitalea sp. XS_ASV28 TaxID=3241296 RepID=UPI003511F93A
MISRRRFLAIAAAAAATPACAAPVRWQGHALGAEVSLTIHAQPDAAEGALHDMRAMLRRVEWLFSLFDPGSRLSELNRNGRLTDPEPELLGLFEQVDRVHRATGGVFDPTIQPLWQAIRNREPLDRARTLLGWDRVDRTSRRVTLDPGQALTLNGIAQGYATDLAANDLRRRGFDRVLVNIGEFSGIGGPWRLGISDPTQGLIATQTLTNRAIATSSPGAMSLGNGQGHIVGPQGQPPLWSTVSVQADSAAIADAASTAFCLMPVAAIRNALPHLPGNANATLVDDNGDIVTLA